MKHFVGNLVLVVVIVSVAATAQQATLRQARKAVVMGLKSAATDPPSKISNIRVSDSKLEFIVDETYVYKKFGACIATGKYEVALRTLGTLGNSSTKGRADVFLYMDGKQLRSTVLNFGPFGSFCGKHPNILGIFVFSASDQTKACADAMNRVAVLARSGTSPEQAAWRDFQQKAAAWRALSPKPPLAEPVIPGNPFIPACPSVLSPSFNFRPGPTPGMSFSCRLGTPLSFSDPDSRSKISANRRASSARFWRSASARRRWSSAIVSCFCASACGFDLPNSHCPSAYPS